MPKLIIWIIGLLLMIATASAIPDLCQYGFKAQTNCSYVTPPLNCTTYNYTIYNMTQQAAIQDNLLLFAAHLYYFEWPLNLSGGKYVISLCDGTQREVLVTDNMVYIANPPKELSFAFDMTTTAGVLFIGVLILIFLILFICSLIVRERVVLFSMINALYGLILAFLFGLTFSLAVGFIFGLLAVAEILIAIYRLRNE